MKKKNLIFPLIAPILLAITSCGGGTPSEEHDPEVQIEEGCPQFVECGNDVQLAATTLYSDSDKVTWSVDDHLIASITSDGLLTGLRKGHVLAKATSVDNEEVFQEIDIEVKKNTLIAVTMTDSTNKMKVGETKKFRAKIEGDSTNSGILWQVNNQALASVTEDGEVTIHQLGKDAKIVVTAYSKINPDAFADVEVTLTAADNGDTSVGEIETKNGYSLIFKDEFDGTRLNKSNWEVMIGDGARYGVAGGWGNEEKQYYSEDNLKVIDGNLVVTAKNEEHRSDNIRGMSYTSGRIRSKGLVAYKYGRIEARISCPRGNGIWPAFWMLPELTDSNYGGWPNSGEIDIMEVKGRIPYSMDGTLHYAKTDGNHVYTYESYSFPEGEDITGFHDYAVEWDEGEIRLYTDDHLYGTFNATNRPWSIKDGTGSFPAPFDKKFHILINMAVGGNYDGHRLPDLEDLPARMSVQHVKWYQK